MSRWGSYPAGPGCRNGQKRHEYAEGRPWVLRLYPGPRRGKETWVARGGRCWGSLSCLRAFISSGMRGPLGAKAGLTDPGNPRAQILPRTMCADVLRTINLGRSGCHSCWDVDNGPEGPGRAVKPNKPGSTAGVEGLQRWQKNRRIKKAKRACWAGPYSGFGSIDQSA